MAAEQQDVSCVSCWAGGQRNADDIGTSQTSIASGPCTDATLFNRFSSTCVARTVHADLQRLESSAFSASQMCFSVTRLSLSHGLSVYHTAGQHLSLGDCLTDALGGCHSQLEYLVHCQGWSESAEDTQVTQGGPV